jgi:hypothetical protein
MADVINGEFSPSESSKSRRFVRISACLIRSPRRVRWTRKKHDSGTINTANRIVAYIVGYCTRCFITFLTNNFPTTVVLSAFEVAFEKQTCKRGTKADVQITFPEVNKRVLKGTLVPQSYKKGAKINVLVKYTRKLKSKQYLKRNVQQSRCHWYRSIK